MATTKFGGINLIDDLEVLSVPHFFNDAASEHLVRFLGHLGLLPSQFMWVSRPTSVYPHTRTICAVRVIPYGEINFAEMIIALVPARQLSAIKNPPHPSAWLRRLRTGRANIG